MFDSSGGLPARDKLPLGQNSSRSSSNEMGVALPLIFGRQRIGCTFISNFFDILSQSVSGGGKGASSAGVNYFASFAVAVGHGPFTTFHDLYLNGDPVFTSSTKLYCVSLTESENVATFQTKNPHGLSTGNTIVNYYAFQPEFNGEFTITVISPTQFQYTIPGTALPTETATPQNGQRIYAVVKLDPSYANGADVTTITIPDFGTADIHWGTETQPVNAYLSNVSGIRHPPYKGICYIVFHQLFLGFNQTNAQNVEVVMERTPSFGWQTNTTHAVINGDCNPGCIVADMLLNKRAGLALDENVDVNKSSLDAAIEQYFTESIGLSPIYTRGDEARTSICDVLKNVDTAPVIDDDGKIALVMNRAPVAPTYVGDVNLVGLPKFKPAEWSQVVNETYLNFLNRDSGWQQDFVPWKDSAGIYAKERPESQVLDRQLVTHRDLALRLVTVAGQIAALPKNDGKITLAFDPTLFAALAPGAAFQFTYSLRPKLNGIYRVTSRTLTDPAKPEFEVEASIDRSYIYGQTIMLSGNIVAGKNVMPDFRIKSRDTIPDPIIPELQPIPTPSPSAIVELPVALCPNGQPAVAAIVTRSTQSDTFATLFLGRNYVFNGAAPESFLRLAILKGFSFGGGLATDFPAATAFTEIGNAVPAEAATPNPFPLVAGCQIQLGGIDLLLPDVCDFDALANSLLLFVGNEIMSIAEAQMTASGAYTLTVIRGRFVTPIEDHTNGDPVWIIPLANLAPLQHPHFLGGNTGRFKLTIGSQDISDVDAFDVVFVGDRWIT